MFAYAYKCTLIVADWFANLSNAALVYLLFSYLSKSEQLKWNKLLCFYFLKCYFGIFTIVNAKVRDVEIDSEDNDFIFGTGRFPEEILVSVFTMGEI